jgi:hypothetical protein
MRRLLVISGLVGLALGGAAPAARAADPPPVMFAVGSPSMQLAQTLAREHWGADACGGQVTLSWTPLAPMVNASASWTNPRSSYDDPQLNGDCRIDFNTTMDFDWTKFCTVVIHEYGHLNGRPHAADVHDVMAAVYLDPSPECVNAAPRQAPQEAAPPAEAVVAAQPSERSESRRPAAKKHRKAKRAKRAKHARHKRRHHRRHRGARARSARVVPAAYRVTG